MRIFIGSDSHLHGNRPGGDEAVIKLADYVCKNGNSDDVLMLLGDYGNSLPSIRACLKLFSSFKGTKTAVLGNHDLWAAEEDTAARFRHLQDELESLDFVALDRRPYFINGYAIVGSIGWYDYSFEDLGIASEVYESKIIPGTDEVCWIDALYTNWGKSDQDVVSCMVSGLGDRLTAAVAKGSRIIVGMHHVPTKRLLYHPRFLVPKEWRFANVYLGSSRFEQLFSRFRKDILHVFCGHQHRSCRRRHGGIKYTSLGGDYRSKELVVYRPESGSFERRLF